MAHEEHCTEEHTFSNNNLFLDGKHAIHCNFKNMSTQNNIFDPHKY